MRRTYTELAYRDSFLKRFQYLSLGGEIGAKTFGWERHLNQAFYQSLEWKRTRDICIVRDNGCDLGVPGHEIHDKIMVHHMNPISPADLRDFNHDIINPEYLVCVSPRTHNAIHYGTEDHLPRDFVERRPGDTVPWKE